MSRVVALAAVVVVGSIIGFGVMTGLSESAAPHPHGPDTHTHGEDGRIIPGENSGPPPTPPVFRDDVPPSFEPVLDSEGEPIETDLGPLTIDVAGLAAAEEAWLADGGDLSADPPPEISDDEWFEQPTNHPLDPRWYAGFDAELSSAGG